MSLQIHTSNIAIHSCKYLFLSPNQAECSLFNCSTLLTYSQDRTFEFYVF